MASPQILHTDQDCYQGLYTACYFEFSPFALAKMKNINHTKVFFKQLIAHGYKSNDIKLLFYKAITCTQTCTGPADDNQDHNDNVILHLPFHLNDPASYKIQQAWCTHVTTPKWKMPLENMKNPKTRQKIQIKWMKITYKGPMNLGNCLTISTMDTMPLHQKI